MSLTVSFKFDSVTSEVYRVCAKSFEYLLTVPSLLCWCSPVYVRVIHLIAMCVSASCASRYALAMCCTSSTTSRNESELRLLLPPPPLLIIPSHWVNPPVLCRAEGGACREGWRDNVIHTYEAYEREVCVFVCVNLF